MQRFFLVLVAFLVADAHAAGDLPATAVMTFTNDVARDVGGLYVSDPGDDDWADELVAVTLDGTVASGDSVEVIGIAGTWDLLVLDPSGAEILRVANISFEDGGEIHLYD